MKFESEYQRHTCPALETNPVVGLCPKIPQKNAGIRMDPPTSDPTPKTDPPDAMSAASPPDDPPTIRPRWYGFLDRPYTLEIIRYFISFGMA